MRGLKVSNLVWTCGAYLREASDRDFTNLSYKLKGAKASHGQAVGCEQ